MQIIICQYSIFIISLHLSFFYTKPIIKYIDNNYIKNGFCFMYCSTSIFFTFNFVNSSINISLFAVIILGFWASNSVISLFG